MFKIFTATTMLLHFSVLIEMIVLTSTGVYSSDALTSKRTSYLANDHLKDYSQTQISATFTHFLAPHKSYAQKLSHIRENGEVLPEDISSSRYSLALLRIISSVLAEQLRNSITSSDKITTPQRLDTANVAIQRTFYDRKFIKNTLVSRNRLKRLIKMKNRNTSSTINNDVDWREKSVLMDISSSDLSFNSGHRHLVKRDSSLITEHCGPLRKSRCRSLQIRECTFMCVNGRRNRRVCRLHHPQGHVLCIVSDSS